IKTSVLRSLGQRGDEDDKQLRARLAQETENEFIERYHSTIDYMYNNGLVTCNRRLKLVEIHFSNQTLKIPIDQLRSIVDSRILNSPVDNLLPFQSQQLSNWLLKNSELIRN
ncbi:unnamed protein product, partial [Rotaria magnacalcarata]